MGVPVSGKNMFPSNIAGLPTWYTIRASKRGYVARKKEVDFLVAMNAETAKEDVLTLEPGAAVVYDEPLKLNALRNDLVFYPVPFDKLVAPVCPDAKLRRLVRNMIYDGVLAKLLGIDLALMEKALGKQLGKKAKAVTLNAGALKAGWDYAEANFTKQDPFVIEPMNETAGKILIEGNAAAAIGCMMAGVTVVAWYPITPSSSLCESLIGYMKKYRVDKETGKATFAIVQAEDEIASLGMVIGASWAGARVDDVDGRPRHLADVRVRRPGVLRRDAGGDLRRAARRAVHRPADAHRAGRPARHGVPLPRRHQAHHAHSLLGGGVLHDGAGGVRPRRAVPDAGVRDAGPRPRHEQLDVGRLHVSGQADQPRQAAHAGDARRSSASGAATRTSTATASRTAPFRATACPRTSRAARATTPRGSTASGPTTTSRTWTGWRASSRRRATHVPKPVVETVRRREDRVHRLRHVALGDRREPRSAARGNRRQDVVLPAARAIRSTTSWSTFIDAHERVYVIEQNRDAQLLQLMKLELTPERQTKLRSVLHYNGLPIDARSITDDVLAQEGFEVAKKTPHAPCASAGMTGGE